MARRNYRERRQIGAAAPCPDTVVGDQDHYAHQTNRKRGHQEIKSQAASIEPRPFRPEVAKIDSAVEALQQKPRERGKVVVGNYGSGLEPDWPRPTQFPAKHRITVHQLTSKAADSVELSSIDNGVRGGQAVDCATVAARQPLAVFAEMDTTVEPPRAMAGDGPRHGAAIRLAMGSQQPREPVGVCIYIRIGEDEGS